ncbi:MAG: DUF3604 domain-containing protein [Planctomycetota bacterium]|jgi:hypothetical protein
MLVASVAPFGRAEILHHFDMADDDRMRLHGSGTHTPIESLAVSEATTVDFEWKVGEESVQTGGDLLVVWRWPFDWSDLQAEDPSGDGFMRMEFVPAADRDEPADDVELSLKYNWIAGIEPWHHQIRINVVSGTLQPGDRVRLTCGDTTEGGAGWRAPTCVDNECRFLMLIDHTGDQRRHRLVQQPSFRVTPGAAVRLRAVVIESDAVVQQPVTLIVRGEDCWGNATELPEAPQITFVDEDGDPDAALVDVDAVRSATHFAITFREAGAYRLKVTSGNLSAVTNRVVVGEELPKLQLFWGDLHSGQTQTGCGSGTLAQSYAFGRDVSGLRFMTHQANDHYVTQDDWQHTREVTRRFDEPGRFVPILGCEWSPLTKDGGDRNVFYFDDEPRLRRSDRFFREAEPDPTPDARTAPEFHDAFRDLNVLVNIHVGGRMTNLDWYEQKIERLCETHSTHGTVEWFFMDALARGYRVGLTAGTDGVMGRPGADHPGRRLIRNLRNGLTAVYATELTREALWEALQQRRCYATTGERIRVWFEVDGQPMGSELVTNESPQIRFRVAGTQAIERVDLFRGVEIIKSWPVASSVVSSEGEVAELRVLWGGTERKGTARLQRAKWDGSLAASNGQLELLETINFQSYDDNARLESPSRIEWTNQSAGNAAGVLVRIHGDDSTELKLESGPTSFAVSLGDVRTSSHRVDAGGVSRFAEIGPPPDVDGPQSFGSEFVDDTPLEGEFPYWIRVTQVDQSLAWSSPVYVRANRPV